MMAARAEASAAEPRGRLVSNNVGSDAAARLQAEQERYWPVTTNLIIKMK